MHGLSCDATPARVTKILGFLFRPRPSGHNRRNGITEGDKSMLLLIGIVLLAFWAMGFFFWHLGTIIWLALVAAAVAFVWHWATHRHKSRT